jgi:hypothetical protein
MNDATQKEQVAGAMQLAAPMRKKKKNIADDSNRAMLMEEKKLQPLPGLTPLPERNYQPIEKMPMSDITRKKLLKTRSI